MTFLMSRPNQHSAMGRTLWGAAALATALFTLAGCGDHTSTTVVEPTPVGGPALLRRLTESQFRATIADIFGPDTPVVGRFERGLRSHGLEAIGTSESGVSTFSVEQYSAIAIGIADYVFSAERRDQFVPCKPESASTFDEACAKAFIHLYGDQLFRRPLDAEQVERFVAAAKAGASRLNDFHQGLKYALIGLLTAPEFTFRIERMKASQPSDRIAELDSYSKAERLSFFLTDSTPDTELLQAAANGELDTKQGLQQQVDRLIGSTSYPRAVRAFFTDLLEFERFNELVKDVDLYPAFNSQVASDAQEQTLRDVVRHLIDDKGDYRDLFTLRTTELTRPLGVVYRVPVASRNEWERYTFPDDSDRIGIQTQLSFLATHSHPGRSSPTLRGKALREVFLCQEVPDPPADVDFSAVQNASDTAMPTARDRLKIHNTQVACSGCHKIMDPPGFGLENFDGLGQFRQQENGVTIDASGDLDGNPFQNPVQMAQALRNHRETPRCVVEKMYRFAVGRDTVWEERDYMDYLIGQFAEEGYRIPDLMKSIALSKNFFAVQLHPSQSETAKR